MSRKESHFPYLAGVLRSTSCLPGVPELTVEEQRSTEESGKSTVGREGEYCIWWSVMAHRVLTLGS